MPRVEEPGDYTKSMEAEIMGKERDVGVEKTCILLFRQLRKCELPTISYFIGCGCITKDITQRWAKRNVTSQYDVLMYEGSAKKQGYRISSS